MSDAKPTASKDLTETRLLNVPVERAWDAWRNPELVRHWWGPTGFTCPVASMDFREGGSSLVCMRAPAEFGGQDMYNTWTYSRIVPLERIEFLLHFTDAEGNRFKPSDMGLPADIPDGVPHVVTFTPCGDHQTELSVSEYGYGSDETVAMSRAGLVQCLDKMAAMFDASPAA